MNTLKPLLPKVTKVQALDDFELRLEFTDGSIRQFDVKPYLHFPAFERLKQGGLFAKAHIANGTVVWETIRAASVADARKRFRAQNQNFLTVLDIFAA